MRESRIGLLVLHAQYTTRLSYLDDWLDAFENFPEFETQRINIVTSDARTAMRRAVGNVDDLHKLLIDETIGVEAIVTVLRGHEKLEVTVRPVQSVTRF